MMEPSEIKKPGGFAERLDGRDRQFEAMFRKFIPDLPKSPRILSVGCGAAGEIPGICAAFPDALVHGIDIDPKEIAKANLKPIFYPDLAERVVFRVADATLDESYGDIKWDMILCRTPDVFEEHGEVFTKMIDASVRALSSGGVLMVTVPSMPRELELEGAFEVLAANPNITTSPAQETDFRRGDNDRYVIVSKKT